MAPRRPWKIMTPDYRGEADKEKEPKWQPPAKYRRWVREAIRDEIDRERKDLPPRPEPDDEGR